MDTTSKKTLTEEIALACREKDTTPNPHVTIAEGESLKTKSCAEFFTSPWELEELINNIWKCIVIYEHNVKKFSARAICRLLGIDKSTIIYIDDKEIKVSSIINLVKMLDGYYLKDPTILEHIGASISSSLLGSFNLGSHLLNNKRPDYESLNLTPNQIIYSQP